MFPVPASDTQWSHPPNVTRAMTSPAGMEVTTVQDAEGSGPSAPSCVLARGAPHPRGRRGGSAPSRATSRCCGRGTARWPTVVGPPRVAGGVRRARRRRARAARLHGGDQPPGRPGPGERDRRVQHRPGHHAVRHPRTAGALPPAHAPGRRDLVAGHVRARRRLGPGLAAHGRGRGRRRLRDQRAEDVELPRPLRRLVPALRAHRSDGEEARRITCFLVDLRTPGIEARPLPLSPAPRPSPSSFSPTPASPARPCSDRSIGAGRWP